MVSLWTSGSSLIMRRENVSDRYPELLSDVTIECDCIDSSCDAVFWFRTYNSYNKVQFLGKCNNAGRFSRGESVEDGRFKCNTGRSMSFGLTIISVTKEDTGIYSCVLQDRQKSETWKPGIRLLPGVKPPTPPPPPPQVKRKPPIKRVCHCSKKNPPQHGCDSLILWPLVGVTVALALSIICTLYYFSRLPKKCRHHFARRR